MSFADDQQTVISAVRCPALTKGRPAVSLIDRLRNSEDQLTERKEPGLSYEEVAKTIVAFANSLRDDQEGILFIGVANNGAIKGVSHPDKSQQWISRIARETVFPPVPIEQHVLEVDDQSVLAVLVRRSYCGPHFAGPAYVRVGSQSVAASDTVFERLIAERLSPLRPIAQALDSRVEVLVDRRAQYGVLERVRANVVEVNAHWILFQEVPNGISFGIASDRISVQPVPSRESLLIIERA